MSRTRTALVMLLLGLLALFACAPAHALNKVRDTRFNWQVLKTDHFDIHYYDGDMLPRAREVGAWLEDAHQKHAVALRVILPGRVPVFIYRNHNQFEQTNLYPAVPEGVGAFAESTRNRIVQPVYPSEKYMQVVLEHELTHIYQYAALYPFRLPSYPLLLSWLFPSWMMEGMADKMASERGSDVDMRLRDSALDGTLRSILELRGFAHLNPHEIRAAYEEGKLFFDYLDEVSGGGSAMRILHSFGSGIPWSVDKRFAMATGTTLRKADERFRLLAAERAWAKAAGKQDPGGLDLTGDYGAYRVHNRSPRWSPDGARVAYISDRGEMSCIYTMNVDGSNRRRLLRGRLNTTIELLSSGDTALGWSRDGSRLCFIGEWVNKDYLYIQGVDGKSGLRRIDLPFDEIRSPAFSPDGKSVALSGVRAGVSDIYVVDLESLVCRQLNIDRYDDESPSWSPDGSMVVYSSERGGQADLYLVNVETRDVTQLTDTFSVERHPCWSTDSGTIAFSSDSGGISNIYTMDIESRNAIRVTDVMGGAFSPSWSPDDGRLLFSYYRHGNMNVFLKALPELSDSGAQLPHEEELAAGLAGFKTQSNDGLASRPMVDRFSLEYLLPLGLTNPFTFSDLRGDHQLYGDIVPYVSESGATIMGEIVWQDLSRRFGFAVRAFSLTEISDTDEDREYGFDIYSECPFDPFRGMSFGIIGYRRDRFTGDTMTSGENRAAAYLALTHDNRIGRGLDITGGTLYRGSVASYSEALGSEREFTNYSLEHARYLTLSRDQILALRLRGDLSVGQERDEFDLSGLVRGLSPNEHESVNRFGATLEYRFPLVRDINAHVAGSYLFLKDIRGYVFGDAGYVTKDDWGAPFDDKQDPAWHSSLGLGLRFDFYLIQQIPFKTILEAQCVDDEWQYAFGLDLMMDF